MISIIFNAAFNLSIFTICLRRPMGVLDSTMFDATLTIISPKDRGGGFLTSGRFVIIIISQLAGRSTSHAVDSITRAYFYFYAFRRHERYLSVRSYT